MPIPIVNACDLFTQRKSEHHVVVHSLAELLKDDVYLPKKPHRHTFYQVLYIRKGLGSHFIDFQETKIQAPVIFFLSPGQVHDLVLLKGEIEGFLINFDEFLLNSFLNKISYIDEFPFFNRNGKISEFIIKEHQDKVDEIFYKIEQNYQVQNVHSQDFIRLYLMELFYMANLHFDTENPQMNYSNQQHIMSNFEKLLEEYFTVEHYPKFYADSLSISPNYLNLVCKNYAGKTCGDMIRKRIILEAKRLLLNSQLSISEIAYQLNFEDNSYFTKFFKQNTEITPFQFRNTINV